MELGPERGARIDVTPMADVVIVLLLIFLVMTPAIAGRGLHLPPAQHAGARLPEPVLWLRADGSLGLGDGPGLPRELLRPRLERELARRPPGQRSVSLRADRATDYAAIRAVLALCREAGAEDVALSTRPLTGATVR